MTSIYYRERDGMRIREANGGWQNSALKSRDGRLWLAAQAGVAVIDPAKVDQHLVPAPLLIEALETAEDSHWLAGKDHISLAPQDRTFRILYTAINFTTPSRMRFRHRLRGYDDTWSEAADRREAAYTRVPAGRYEFQVEASRGDGVWTAEPTSMSVIVAPYFYETLGFKGLVILGFSGLLGLLYQLRTRSLVRRRTELEAEVRERTEALRLEKRLTEEQGQKLIRLDRIKSQFFTNVSHEFRTPLTLLPAGVRGHAFRLQMETRARSSLRTTATPAPISPLPTPSSWQLLVTTEPYSGRRIATFTASPMSATFRIAPDQSRNSQAWTLRPNRRLSIHSEPPASSRRRT